MSRARRILAVFPRHDRVFAIQPTTPRLAAWPFSMRAASSLLTAAFTACMLRNCELISEVTTKLANCPAKR